MGAWGTKAFESDAGLDVIDAIRRNLPENGELTLQTILKSIKDSDWQQLDDPAIGISHTSPLAVTELIFKIRDGDYSSLDYTDDRNQFENLKSFTADKESLIWLKDYLTENLAAARHNAATSEDPANPYNNWFYEENWVAWQEHMETLIGRLDSLIADDTDLIELKQPMSETMEPAEETLSDEPTISM